MKSYKKILIATLIVSISTSLFGQTFGVKAGLNLATMSHKLGSYSYDPTAIAGINVGLISEIAFQDNLFLQPGILFSTKGSQYTISGSTGTITTSNIEVPINVMYKHDLGSLRLLGFAGPYIGLAVGGKIKSGGISQDMTFSGDNRDMNSFDFGLNIGVGVEVGNFQISAQYGLGLANLANTTYSDSEVIKNGVFGISVVYLFGGK